MSLFNIFKKRRKRDDVLMEYLDTLTTAINSWSTEILETKPEIYKSILNNKYGHLRSVVEVSSFLQANIEHLLDEVKEKNIASNIELIFEKRIDKTLRLLRYTESEIVKFKSDRKVFYNGFLESNSKLDKIISFRIMEILFFDKPIENTDEILIEVLNEKDELLENTYNSNFIKSLIEKRNSWYDFNSKYLGYK